MDNIIEQIQEFLTKSDSRYSTPIQRAMMDLNRVTPGNFWNSKYWPRGTITKFKRNNRLNLDMNNWTPMVNAISSPISNSPWHVELTDKTNAEEIQKLVDNFESDSETKETLISAFNNAVLTGYGYIVITTVADELTGEPKVILEAVDNLSTVALDPNCVTPDGSDAEEGAIINYISTKKAKRLYGEDVVPFTYPDTPCAINFNIGNFKQWNLPEDSVGVVTYYTKNQAGTVDYYKVVGDKVVEQLNLPIKYIPIIRLAGTKILEQDRINYNGIVQQSLSLVLGANMAYSSLIERSGRSTKANYMVHEDSVIPESLAACNQDDSVAVMWKGEIPPVPITEAFETGDLQNIITVSRTLMEDTLGVPLTGIVDQRERTATEILRQEISKESNTAVYYNHAYKAMRTLGRIVIELMTGGQDLIFTLENGPSVITRQMKQRQELQALATIMPDSMKPIIAKYFADTLKNEVGEELGRNIVANLPPDVNFVADIEDPVAIHQLNQMKAQMEQTMEELEKMKVQNDELRTQLTMSQVSMLDNREQRQLDWNKFTVAEQDKVALEMSKLGVQEDKNTNEAVIKQQEVNIKAAESEMNQQQIKSDAYIEGVSDALTAG